MSRRNGMKFGGKITATSAPPSVILIRLTVGAVFLSEGIQKFLFPADLGVGRFARIGIPAPQIMAPFMGVIEIVGGMLIIFYSVAMAVGADQSLASSAFPSFYNYWRCPVSFGEEHN